MTERARLKETLERLYREEIAAQPGNGYLREHEAPIFVDAQVRTFEWYRPHLPASGAILDWGANHGPDSCLLRATYGDAIELHACDFPEPGRYPVFQAFAHSQYRKLDDIVALPYDANFFDAVIASGVLEHTAMDDESLKELHRIMKPGAPLVISYLPNWLSVKEWKLRVIDRRDFHKRRYSIAGTIALLKRRGFEPKEWGYHSFFWERRLERLGFSADASERIAGWLRKLPFDSVKSTLCLIAVKVNGF